MSNENKEIEEYKEKVISDFSSLNWLRYIINRSKFSTHEEIEKEEHFKNHSMMLLCQVCNSFLSVYDCFQIKEFEYYIYCHICDIYYRLEIVLIMITNPNALKMLEGEKENE